MRIVMSIDTVNTGWSGQLEWARGLAGAGAETMLAILGTPTPEQEQALQDSGLKAMTTHAPVDWLAQDRDTLEAASRAVARFANVINPDVVHLGSPSLAAFGHIHAPLVVTCDPRVAEPNLAPLWRVELAAQGYVAAAAAVATTQAVASSTAQSFGFSQTPSVVPRHRPKLAPTGLPHSVRDFALTTAQTWDDAENWSVLNAAAARISAPVMVAAPGERADGTAVEFGNLWSLGPMGESELARWLAAAPVFVSPARCDLDTVPVLEAAHLGCALVLADHAAYRELWEGAAVFVDPDDEAGFAHAIGQLVADPELGAQWGAAAAARADENTDTSAQLLINVYRALNEHKRAA